MAKFARANKLYSLLVKFIVIKFLRHVVPEKGISHIPNKLEQITDWRVLNLLGKFVFLCV